MKDDKKIKKKDNKQMLNDTNKKLLFIAIPVVVILLLVGFISISNMTGLMGNSATTNNYKCEDSTFELKGNKCVKQVQEKAYLIGDVNKDGAVDIYDVRILRNYTVDKVSLDDYQQILGDVNKDGRVDRIDTALLEKYMGSNANGSFGSSNYINQMTCRDGFEFKDNYCYGTITVDAIYIGSNNNDTPISTDNNSNTEKTVAYYIGDVNKDGAVDILDVNLLQKYFGGSSELDDYQKILGDVNKDGAVDVFDMTILKKYINGPQSGTASASSFIYHRACPAGEKLVGTNCFKQ